MRKTRNERLVRAAKEIAAEHKAKKDPNYRPIGEGQADTAKNTLLKHNATTADRIREMQDEASGASLRRGYQIP
mgnify:CR=1 FL=1